MDPERNRWARLLTSKIREHLNLNCVYFLPLPGPHTQGRRLQPIAWAAAIKKIGTSQERMAFMKRNLCIGAAFLALIAALGFGARVLEKKAAVEAATVQAPMFEVDPMWPKPLPNHWVIGMTIGVSADAQDNIWIIHRGGSLEFKEKYGDTNPPGAECCVTAPPVLEFDKAGNLIRSEERRVGKEC
jgi:hypothetical protein